MRKMCLDMVYELAKRDRRIVFIGSDLGAGTLNPFKAEMPERFFMEGVSEANVVGMAAGMAMEGKIVYVNTIATFLTRRCFEQVALDLCLHNVNVRLIGNGGGVVYAPLGPTHEAIEDIAIFRALPRMTILAVADAEEMRRMMPQTVEHPGPIYIRLGKGDEPVVTRDVPFEIGRAYVMREGRDALIVSTGVVLKAALDAAEALAAEGLQAAVLHVPTVKPFDTARFLELARAVPVIVSVEEHSILGGLGGTVAEILAETDFDSPKRFRRIGLPDAFPDQYGSQASLLKRYGVTAEKIVSTVRALAAT
ncbi:MAG: transketolase C-terminal domain-containing protein [Verrucomicrobiales bacterium]|nr:transketolase C-terminal domain-containing protein [Verrucomicrobiales bacterium]